jgi:hypothetical protein
MGILTGIYELPSDCTMARINAQNAPLTPELLPKSGIKQKLQI